MAIRVPKKWTLKPGVTIQPDETPLDEYYRPLKS